MNIVSQDFAAKATSAKESATVHRLNSLPAKLRNAVEVAEDCQIINIFANFDQEPVQDTASNINLMRVSQRSKVARSRLLALRRQVARCTHSMPRRQSAKYSDRSIKDLRAMRAHIFTDDAPMGQQYSLPLRIATHSINMALILAVLPIGAASLTYNLLRGEDMAITARLTTLAGLVLVFFGGQASNLLGSI